MKIRLLVSALFLITIQGIAQVTLKSERDSDGNVLIYADNTTPIPYTVTIKYQNLQNLVPNGGMTAIKVVSPGRSQIARLKKENPTQTSTNLNYTYTYRGGDIKAQPIEDFVYLPPVKSGEKINSTPMTHIENTLRNKQVNDSYVGLAFIFDEPTTICAPRKGVVSEIKIDEEIEGSSVHYNSLDNFIEIYHEDGVFSKIMVLKPGSAKVKVGDTVFPGDALAESAGENYGTGPHVRMVQSKLVKTDDLITRSYTEVSIRGTDGVPIQVKDRIEILVEHPEEIILLEMTKKEKKKYLIK